MLLDDLIVYREAVAVGECVWNLASSWDWFAKQTVGRQMVRSADSISANIAEGHGLHYFGENRQFCYYARGSLHELESWTTKCRNRSLIPEADFKELQAATSQLARILNDYIKSIGRTQNR